MRYLLLLFFVCSASFADIDWAAAKSEATDLFRSLIQVDTSNPPADGKYRETEVARMLQKLFKREGIPAVVYEETPGSGRGNVIARVKGDGSKKPLLLLGHLDVVPVEREHWTSPPFEAAVKGGRIYGRGAADMKDLVAAEVMMLVLVQRHRIPLSRDLIFAGVADEESGGERGIAFLVDKHLSEIQAEFALNEGLGRPSGKDGKVKWVGIETNEKRGWNLTLSANGTSGHSSIPLFDNPLVALSKLLVKVEQFDPAVSLNPVTDRYARELIRLGEGDPSVETSGLHHAMYHDTFSPTIMKAGFRENVIPRSAWATVNARLLPQTDWHVLLKDIKHAFLADNPKLTLTPDFTPDDPTPPSPADTALVQAYQSAVHKKFGAAVPVIPIQGVMTTDSRYLRNIGIPSYGISPFSDPHPELRKLHGDDESVDQEAFKDGVQFLYQIIEAAAAP